MATALPRTALPVLSSPAAGAGCGSRASTAPAAVRTLVDEFLAEQSSTSAVERFADVHDGPVPAQARWYRDLLPATAPGPGQQYAFEVDLDACSGCKACVVACHSLNGLDEGESWREVGLLVGEDDLALQQPVPTGCHHCVDPGCLEGCPVDAYVKLDDGIVQHLDDQCIGCSYCTLTCPYEVPRFDHDRGIVRKCDLCHDRLAVGEAPACVQACPTEAIRITVVDVEQAGREGFGFDAPAPETTRPATVFRSQRDLSTDVAPADRATLRPRRAHTPLSVMLVLTQLAVGAFLGVEALRLTGIPAASAAVLAAITLVTTVVALVASLAHLGRPQYAWRAVLGVRHSWLSREIVAFGAFAPLGVLHAVAVWGPSGVPLPPPAVTGPPAVVAGLAAVAASVMVYVATGREGWPARGVAPRFGLTTAALGLAATAVAAAALDIRPGALAPMLGGSVALVVTALVVDLLPLRHVRSTAASTRGRTARLLRGPLWGAVQLRLGLGLVSLSLLGAAALAVGAASGTVVLLLAAAGLVAATAAEGVARWWFFTAEGSPRMPGVPA